MPGSWVLQGHGIPIYTNVDYPFDTGDYPSIPLSDETGDYWRQIDVPKVWTGRRVVLRIGAAESMVEVFVNGKAIGLSTDSRLPAEFDVTSEIMPGEPAVVALRVHRWSASTWLEDQDMWWMAGLHRSIALYATHPNHLTDLVFTTLDLSPDGAEALVEVRADITIAEPEPEPRLDLEVELVDPGGDRVFAGSRPAGVGGGSHSFEARLSNPLLWSAETPNLYRLRVRLRSRAGSVLDERWLSVGVRTVSIGGGSLQVNGNPITIRGVNRHEHDGELGRV